MTYSGFSVAQPPEIPRAGRKKKTIDPSFLSAYAEALEALGDDGTVVALADTFAEKKHAHRAVVLLKHGLVDANLVADISTLRARVWQDGESFRAGLRIGAPRVRKPKAEATAETAPAAPAEAAPVATPEPAPVF